MIDLNLRDDLVAFPMTSDSPEDPHVVEKGSYLVKGVNLVASCDGYDPVGLLLWLPLDGRYGLWDGEHGTLRVFGADVNWLEIVGDLPRHINAHWVLDDSAPVFDFGPWTRHPYNPEQLNHPLPDIPEWYEASWVRRGVYQNGAQLRFPEEMRIRFECDGDRCNVTAHVKEAEKAAIWSPIAKRLVTRQEWQRIQPWLEAGFWNQPSMPGGDHPGETETMWTLSGYRAGRYHRLFRSYDANSSAGDPVHELGIHATKLAGIHRFETDN
jgi:hypothetical protein